MKEKPELVEKEPSESKEKGEDFRPMLITMALFFSAFPLAGREPTAQFMYPAMIGFAVLWVIFSFKDAKRLSLRMKAGDEGFRRAWRKYVLRAAGPAFLVAIFAQILPIFVLIAAAPITFINALDAAMRFQKYVDSLTPLSGQP